MPSPDANYSTFALDRRRLSIALAIAAISAGAAYAFLARPNFGGDWFHVWAAARTMLAGDNPYLAPPAGPLNPGNDPLFYPLPALLLVAPIAWLPLAPSGAIFLGVSSGLLAYFLTRDGLYRLPLFMSAPFLMAVSLGQWSPLLAAAALEPNVGFVAAAKPNLGLASWVYRPSIRAIVGGLVLVLISFLVLPTWVADWLRNISGRPEKLLPIGMAWGPILLLAVIRWRQPFARLFLVMTVVPQALFFYDQLLLMLAPRTFRQSLLLALSSHALLLLWLGSLEPGDLYVREAIPYAAAFYLPVLAVLLWPAPKSREREAEADAEPAAAVGAP